MNTVLVSACLLGQPVRYDGQHRRCSHPQLAQWLAEGRVVAVCPELEGGLGQPRPPCEIENGAGGDQVLAGRAKVIDAAGRDYSPAFLHGADAALALAKQHGVRIALLKEASPSCGSRVIYDGSFGGKRCAGQGVTTARLEQAGIAVFSEEALAEAALAFAALEAEPVRT